MLLERPQCAGQLLLATEVPFGVHHARGRQAEVRTLRARGSEHLVGQQRGILPEDRLLQLGELGARIQTEFGSEQPPRPAHGGERVRLPALAVLRHAQHTQRRSRNGASATRARASAATSATSPAWSRASRSSSSTPSRISSRRPDAIRAGSQSRSST